MDYPLSMDPVTREEKDQTVPQSARQKLENYLKTGKVDEQGAQDKPLGQKNNDTNHESRIQFDSKSGENLALKIDKVENQTAAQEQKVNPAERDTAISGR